MPLGTRDTVVPWPQPSIGDGDAALLDLLGPVDGLHVLVIGAGGLGAMLALHRRGAAQVTAMRASGRLHGDRADAALVPALATVEQADGAIACARRAIRPLNSLVLRLTPAAAPALLPHLRQRLGAAGLSLRRTVALGRSVALVADLPLYGRLRLTA